MRGGSCKVVCDLSYHFDIFNTVHAVHHYLYANAAILGFKGEIDESLPTPRRKCEFTLYWLLLFIYFVCCMLDLKLHSLIYVH